MLEESQVNKLMRRRNLPARGIVEQEPACAVQIWAPNCIVPLQIAQVQVSTERVEVSIERFNPKAVLPKHYLRNLPASPPSRMAACGHCGDGLLCDSSLISRSDFKREKRSKTLKSWKMILRFKAAFSSPPRLRLRSGGRLHRCAAAVPGLGPWA